VLPALPWLAFKSKKNHITFDLKISYVKKLPCLEAHIIPYSQKKFQKITATLDASSRVTKGPKTHFEVKGALGVKKNTYGDLFGRI
jgi:hypothetical protein